jgi:hypothetical protein
MANFYKTVVEREPLQYCPEDFAHVDYLYSRIVFRGYGLDKKPVTKGDNSHFL